MRPIKLTVSGFGPYASCEEIDFEAFGHEGLFLITGATGGGKTTIFDGITYALYGETSGTAREKDFLRSDFAGQETDTFVELSFSHKGQEYKVVRSPRYSRKKKRGQGEIVKNETAILYEEGKMPVTALKEVNQRLHEIMGISYRQFKQIAMLAQGEFLDLLLANSKDRVEIFRNLFGTQQQEQFQKKLTERAKEAYGALLRNKHKLEEVLAQVQTEKEEIKEALAKDAVSLKILAEQIQAEIEEDQKAVSGFSRDIKEIEKKIKKLTERNQEYEAAVKRCLEQQKKVLKCTEEKAGVEKKLEAAVKAAEEEKLLFEQRKTEFKRQQEQKKELLEKLAEELMGYQNAEDELSGVLVELVRVEEELKKYKDLEKRRKGICSQQKKLTEAQKNYRSAEKKWESVKCQYEEKDRIYRAAAIGLAARYLEEGKPCPVCGSKSHPSPAVVSKEVPDEKEVESFKQRLLQAEEEKNRVYETAAREKGGLETMEKEYEAALAALQLEAADVEVSREALTTLEKQQKQRRRRLEIAIKEKRELQGQKEQTEKEQTALWEKKEQAEKEHEKKLSEVKKEEEKQKLLAEGKKMLLEENKKQLVALEREKQKLEERYDTEVSLREEILRLEKEKKLLLEEKEKRAVKITVNEKAWHSILEKQKEKKLLEEKYSLIKGLEQAAVGKNKDRMVFEQYVLAAYFQDIITAANLRMAKMSDGRYQLSRVERVSDGRTTDSLMLEVLDNFTGKKRPVKTLSGGESFKAALALALGLSDVVQAYAGGIQIDTLFIDEGFGTLDEESMEQAMNTLEGLTGHNRLIGIISHVPELKERIEKQIVVEKGRTGSHIKTVV